jgi:hypothetical protein
MHCIGRVVAAYLYRLRLEVFRMPLNETCLSTSWIRIRLSRCSVMTVKVVHFPVRYVAKINSP